jgi:hypothetical protein
MQSHLGSVVWCLANIVFFIGRNSQIFPKYRSYRWAPIKTGIGQIFRPFPVPAHMTLNSRLTAQQRFPAHKIRPQNPRNPIVSHFFPTSLPGGLPHRPVAVDQLRRRDRASPPAWPRITSPRPAAQSASSPSRALCPSWARGRGGSARDFVSLTPSAVRHSRFWYVLSFLHTDLTFRFRYVLYFLAYNR